MGTALLLTAACAGDSVAPAAGSLAFARSLITDRPPDEFQKDLADDPERGIPELSAVAEALATADADQRRELQDYVVEAARARGDRLVRLERPWSEEDVVAYLTLVVLDPRRFAEEEGFRGFVLEIAREALPPGIPPKLRDRLLERLNTLDGLTFDASEEIEVAWGAAPRRSGPRQVPYSATHGRFADDLQGRIVASVYSFPSRRIAPDAAEGLLRAVRRIAPRRTVVVLSDDEPHDWLRGGENASNIVWVRSYGRTYSPWPRDPFSFLRRPDGGVLLLVRPNVQRQRENDAWMARELIQGIPGSLDAAWGRVRWERSPVPFHNGQILALPRTVWVSVHSLEVRILQLLGEQRVPVASLADRAGWSRYVAAAGEAAGELASLYGRRVELVHPLDPATVPDSAFLEALGGGAGYDLDSLLTPLINRGDRTVALVADIDAGLEVLRRSTVDDLDRCSARWGTKRAGDELRREITGHQQSPHARRLDAFLEMVSTHLRQTGVEVSRLPLLWIPPELMARPERALEQPFLITWNNVVQERVEGRMRAEGFAGLLPAGDDWARDRFSESGYDLELLPPLVESVVHNGGYRCASQHLRE